jgi:diaminopimelate epimerase
MPGLSAIPFIKMHGLGNDFIVLDETREALPRLTPELARLLCDRRFGIGADQILHLKKPQAANADVRMEIWNADGTTAEMCGNGIRAVALHQYRHGARLGREEYAVETLAGLKTVRVSAASGGETPAPEALAVTVNMGAPKLGGGFGHDGEAILAGSQQLTFFEVNMGNPHAVIFVDDVARYPVEDIGPLVENHSRFPRRTNVEFVQVMGPNEITVRVWERGAGVTLACGTGACASAVASLALRRVSNPVKVALPGGSLSIRWDGALTAPDAPVMMEGPAVEVFRGEFLLPVSAMSAPGA